MTRDCTAHIDATTGRVYTHTRARSLSDKYLASVLGLLLYSNVERDANAKGSARPRVIIGARHLSRFFASNLSIRSKYGLGLSYFALRQRAVRLFRREKFLRANIRFSFCRRRRDGYFSIPDFSPLSRASYATSGPVKWSPARSRASIKSDRGTCRLHGAAGRQWETCISAPSTGKELLAE